MPDINEITSNNLPTPFLLIIGLAAVCGMGVGTVCFGLFAGFVEGIQPAHNSIGELRFTATVVAGAIGGGIVCGGGAYGFFKAVQEYGPPLVNTTIDMVNQFRGA